MTVEEREQLIDTGLRLVSWLRNSFPDVLADLARNCGYQRLADCIRETPTLFWSAVGNQDYEVLVQPSANGESILGRVVATVQRSSPAVQNEILVGFVEGHMFPRPNSPLARELSQALGHNRIGDVL